MKHKSDSKKKPTSELNKLVRSPRLPESSKTLNELSGPSTASRPNRKSSRNKTSRHSQLLLLRNKSRKLPPPLPHLARLAVEARKEAKRRAKDKPQFPSRWASSDPG